VDGLVNPQGRNINIDTLGKILGETLHLDFVEREFENAALTDAGGISLEVDGNPGPQGNAAFDFVEIHMQDITVPDVPLGILDKRIVGFSVYLHFDNGTFGNIFDAVGKFQSIQIN
jgi:hypothetical protein